MVFDKHIAKYRSSDEEIGFIEVRHLYEEDKIIIRNKRIVVVKKNSVTEEGGFDLIGIHGTKENFVNVHYICDRYGLIISIYLCVAQYDKIDDKHPMFRIK